MGGGRAEVRSILLMMSKLGVNQQIGWFAFNRFSDPDNVQKRDIPLPAFNLTQPHSRSQRDMDYLSFTLTKEYPAGTPTGWILFQYLRSNAVSIAEMANPDGFDDEPGDSPADCRKAAIPIDRQPAPIRTVLGLLLSAVRLTA